MQSLSPYNKSKFFPPAENANDDDYVFVGGPLNTEWLFDAYTHGIFPWPYGERSPVIWASPDPRGIFELSDVHFSRRLLRTCRSNRFQVTFNQAFAQVIRNCAECHGGYSGTWITPSMMTAYTRFHEAGYAKSVEVWHRGELVGGTYGVAIRGLFAAESMFYHMTDASKVALYFLVNRLRERNFALFDIQMVTGHTERLGAVDIPRTEYLERLDAALKIDTNFDEGTL